MIQYASTASDQEVLVCVNGGCTCMENYPVAWFAWDGDHMYQLHQSLSTCSLQDPISWEQNVMPIEDFWSHRFLWDYGLCKGAKFKRSVNWKKMQYGSSTFTLHENSLKPSLVMYLPINWDCTSVQEVALYTIPVVEAFFPPSHPVPITLYAAQFTWCFWLQINCG